MKMSESWKSEDKPISINEEELNDYFKNGLYDGKSRLGAKDKIAYIEGEGFANSIYKKQADLAIYKLVALTNIQKFDELKTQFASSKSVGAMRDNIDIIKSTAEALCYQIEQQKLPLSDNFKATILVSTLNACPPGAANNMQEIANSLQESSYHDKAAFIKAKFTEKVASLFPGRQGSETHMGEEISALLNAEYKTEYNIQDTYASFNQEEFLTAERFAPHRKFKAELDELFSSREGVYDYVGFVAAKETMSLPEPGSKLYELDDKGDLKPTEELQKITMLAHKMNITTDQLIKNSEDISLDAQLEYSKDYDKIICAAVTDQLTKEGLVEHTPIDIRRE